MKEYIEHIQDIWGNPSCWGDHLATLAAVVVLGVWIDTFWTWTKDPKGMEQMTWWEWLQVISIVYLPLWWMYVFTSLYFGGF